MWARRQRGLEGVSAPALVSLGWTFLSTLEVGGANQASCVLKSEQGFPDPGPGCSVYLLPLGLCP